MPRRIFPAGTVTNTTGAPLRLEFYPTSTSTRRETDMWTVDSSNNLVERITNGVIVTDSVGAYSAFAGPDDLATLYALPDNTSSRTTVTASDGLFVPGDAGPTWATPAASTTLTGTLAAWVVAAVDCTAGAGARTLPAASSVAAGTPVSAKKADTSANNLVVSRAGSDLIFGTGSGSTSKTLSLAGEAVEFVSNGVNRWTVRSSDTPSGVLATTYSKLLTPVTVVTTATATLNGLHLADSTTAAFTITIPSGTATGDRIAVLKTNAHPANITLSGAIDITTTRVLRRNGAYWLGQWDGSTWRTLAGDSGYLDGSNYGATPQHAGVLRKWAKALANVRTGTASAKVLCVGDSTTIGAGTSTTHEWQASWPTVMAELMNQTVVPTMVGLGAPSSDLAGGGTTDDRWGIGSGWVNAGSASNLGWGGTGCLTAPTSSASALTYTSGITADTYDVYWLRSSGTGTFSIAATGGSTTNISAGGSTAVVKTTVTAANASSANVVTITPTDAANPIYIVGVEPSLSAFPCVKVGNPSQDGSKATGWTQSTSLGGVPCIKAYAPDLTFINLGINDGGAGISLANLTIAIQAIITGALISGDVILVGISPTSTAANTDTLRTSYIPALRSLAEINGCGWIAVQDRLGAYSAANTLGIMAGDGLHPNALGHADIAKAMLRAIDI